MSTLQAVVLLLAGAVLVNVAWRYKDKLGTTGVFVLAPLFYVVMLAGDLGLSSRFHDYSVALHLDDPLATKYVLTATVIDVVVIGVVAVVWALLKVVLKPRPRQYTQ